MGEKLHHWRLQRGRRARGWYFQAVYGRGKDRQAYTLGYLTEEEAAVAEAGLTKLGGDPGLLVIRSWDRDGAAPPPPTRATVAAALKAALLDESMEALVEALAEHAIAEATRLEAAGRYAEMKLKDFVTLVYWPVRLHGKKKDIRDRERWMWSPIFESLGPMKVSDLNLHRWTLFLLGRETWSPRTKQIAQNHYRGALKYAVEIGALTEVHPFRTIPGGNKRHTQPGESLTEEEVAAVLEAATTPMHRALFATTIGQGARPGEVTRLRWEDVDWEVGRLRFQSASKTLTARSWVPMTPLTLVELRGYWRELGQPTSGFSFEWKGRPINSWRRSWRTAVRQSGIDPDGTRKLTPYSGRYTFATLAAVAGVPRAAVRAGMRHSTSSRILETVYERLRDEQVAEAMSAFPSCLPETPNDKEGG